MSDQSSFENKTEPERTIIVRGILMVIFLVFFGIAETLLFIVTVIQFFWMLTQGSPHERVAEFGKNLANWLSMVALFQSGASEDLPFPWRNWN